jgi:phosphoglycolate phosphatase-like HAD superfamily hydrolase
MAEIIAVIFDFDDTLAPDSTSGLLQELGVDVQKFWKEEVQKLLNDDWDPVPAYLASMISMSQAGTVPTLTKKTFENWGRNLELHAGVPETFERLRQHAASINPRVSLEFYLISSGIEEILRATSVAKEFRDIWGCQFAYDDTDSISQLKKIVSFTDKTRYVFHVQKGIFGNSARGKPFEVNRKVPEERVRIPMSQMIFVGDGYTDIPCFSLIRKNGGVAIGVYDQEHRGKWGRAWGFVEDGRVSNLVPADYAERSALTNSLIMAIESMASRIRLNATTYQG